MRRIAIALGLAATLLTAAALSGVGRSPAAHGASDPATGGVTVTGHGIVTVVPDRATFSFGVVTRATTAAAALAANAASATKLVAALKARGAQDLRTEQISLTPQQRPNGTISGYEAQNTVSAASPIAQTGNVIDAAVGAGANTIGGPSLEVAERDARYRDALKLAVDDARRKADALAKAGGFGVGPVTAVRESGTATPLVAQASLGATRDKTPVEPGTQEVSADIEVTFTIR